MQGSKLVGVPHPIRGTSAQYDLFHNLEPRFVGVVAVLLSLSLSLSLAPASSDDPRTGTIERRGETAL